MERAGETGKSMLNKYLLSTPRMLGETMQEEQALPAANTAGLVHAGWRLPRQGSGHGDARTHARTAPYSRVDHRGIPPYAIGINYFAMIERSI